MINQYDFLKELKMCLHELSLVDDTMETVGSPKKYQPLRKWIIRITIGFIVYVFYHLAHKPILFLISIDIYQIVTRISVFEIFDFYFPLFVYISSALIWETIVGLVYI